MEMHMNIYLNVPYSEKDSAKLLGARWDAVVRRWYYTEKQDALLFVKWFDKATSVVEKNEIPTITLKEFVLSVYGEHHASLTYKAAKVFGVPYPLQSGWLKKYGDRVANRDRLVFGKKQKKTKPKKPAKPAPVVTKTFTPLCNCNVLPWEDCEHTDALAHKAMLEMTGQVTS